MVWDAIQGLTRGWPYMRCWMHPVLSGGEGLGVVIYRLSLGVAWVVFLECASRSAHARGAVFKEDAAGSACLSLGCRLEPRPA